MVSATDRTSDAMRQSRFGLWRCAVFELDGSRKHALECLRLEADCMQLAVKTHGANLQSHFVRMAKVWAALADSGPSNTQTRKPH